MDKTPPIRVVIPAVSGSPVVPNYSDIERNHIAELTSQIHSLGEENENLRVALHRILSVGFIQKGYMASGKPYGYYEHTVDGHEECHAIADLAYRGLFDWRRP